MHGRRQNYPKDRFGRESWTIDGKIIWARLAMADEPERNDFKVLQELTK